jgi:hypothetical protein
MTILIVVQGLTYIYIMVFASFVAILKTTILSNTDERI